MAYWTRVQSTKTNTQSSRQNFGNENDKVKEDNDAIAQIFLFFVVWELQSENANKHTPTQYYSVISWYAPEAREERFKLGWSIVRLARSFHRLFWFEVYVVIATKQRFNGLNLMGFWYNLLWKFHGLIRKKKRRHMKFHSQAVNFCVHWYFYVKNSTQICILNQPL